MAQRKTFRSCRHGHRPGLAHAIQRRDVRWMRGQSQSLRGRIWLPTRVRNVARDSPFRSSRILIRRELINSFVAGASSGPGGLSHAANTVLSTPDGQSIPHSGMASVGSRPLGLWNPRGAGCSRDQAKAGPGRRKGRREIAGPGRHFSKQVPGQSGVNNRGRPHDRGLCSRDAQQADGIEPVPLCRGLQGIRHRLRPLLGNDRRQVLPHGQRFGRGDLRRRQRRPDGRLLCLGHSAAAGHRRQRAKPAVHELGQRQVS